VEKILVLNDKVNHKRQSGLKSSVSKQFISFLASKMLN